METVNYLPLLEGLTRGSVDRFEPTVDDQRARVEYPEAAQFLDPGVDASAVLEALAADGFLEESFQRRSFACPDCGDRDLRFTTACPACGSPDTTPATDGDGHEGHRCRACDEWTAERGHRLDCSSCRTYAPGETVELVEYSYTLADEQADHLEAQLAVRDAAADMLEGRGFQVRLNAVLEGESGAAYPVAIHAVDDILGIDIAAVVHHEPTVEDVRTVVDLASDTGARAIVFTVVESPAEEVTTLAEENDVVLLSPREEGGDRSGEADGATDDPDATDGGDRLPTTARGE